MMKHEHPEVKAPCYPLLQEKQNYIPDELGRDAQTVAALQRKHANFETDLVTLESQVTGLFVKPFCT